MTRHEYLDKLDANLSGRASDIQTHYQDMSAGYERPKPPSCRVPGTVHSDDIVAVYHGTTDALILCGFHASQGTQTCLNRINRALENA